jgi:uncharacterized protein YggE
MIDGKYPCLNTELFSLLSCYIFRRVQVKILGYIILLAISSNVFSSPIPDFPFVTVTGDSIRKVAPDSAVINLQVLTFAKESSKAHDDLNKTIQDILTILKKNGVSTKNISSYEIRKDTKRARKKNGYNNLDILGYELSQTFEVKLENLEYYSTITSELTKINNVEDIASKFDVSNRENIEIELITEAGKKAKLKAKQMALGLGVKIDSVFAINDSGSYKSFFATFGLNTGGGINFNSPSMSVVNSMFIPKYIEISKSINVVYKLEE